MNTPDALALSASPPKTFHTSHTSQPNRKRKRKTFACKVCRSRKLKCDQTFPSCARCQRSGVTCIYGRDEDTDDAFESAASYVRVARSDRPPELESVRDGLGFPIHPKLTSRSQARDIVSGNGGDSKEEVQETMVFKGKEFKTQFFGPTNSISPIIHFPELRTFMTERVDGGVRLARMQNDLRSFKAKIKKLHQKIQPTGTLIEKLTNLFPPRDTAFQYAQLYWDQIESTYRILHAPTFWKDFECIWDVSCEPTESFAIIVSLVFVLGRIATIEQLIRYNGPSSMARELAVNVVDIATEWLEKQSRKHTTLEFFQIQILSHITKRVTFIKKKRFWEDSRMMISNALASGFHRDPSYLASRITPLQQEIRRRLWATMMELELQASLDRGMPSSLAGIHWDCDAPSNLDDSEITPELTILPKSKPNDSFTQTSFLRICHKTSEYRLALCTILNNSSLSRFSHEDLLEHDERINQMLEELPDWKSAPADKVTTIDHKALVQSLIEMQLHQFLAIIHSSFNYSGGSNGGSTSSQLSYSAIGSLNACISYIDRAKYLVDTGILHVFLTGDISRIGMILCQTVCTSSRFEKKAIFQSLVPTATKSAENALDLLYEMIIRIGQGIKEYWYLACACGVLNSRSHPKTDQKQVAVERCTAVYVRLLGSQDDLLGSANNVDLSDLVPLSIPILSDQLISQETNPQNSHPDFFNTDTNMLPGMDLTNWTLSDMWNFET